MPGAHMALVTSSIRFAGGRIELGPAIAGRPFEQVARMSEAKSGIMSQRRVTGEPRSGCSSRLRVTLV
jgi:hypothetical protein